jgi:type I restriction enzyme R subunit
MVSKTNEQALESAIEKALTGTCLEELSGGVSMVAEPQGMASEPVELYRGGNGFYIGNATDCHRYTCLTHNYLRPSYS